MARALLATTLLLCIIALASSARMEPARRMLEESEGHNHAEEGHDHTAHAEEGHGVDHGTHSMDIKYVQLNLTEINGVWFGEADQIPAPIADAYTSPGFPNCSASLGLFDYQHYAPNDPHYRTIVTSQDATMTSSFGHNRASTSVVDAYDSEEGRMNTTAADGTRGCTHFRAYVDLRSGEVKATTLWKRVWRTAANGTVVRDTADCEIQGDEEPGCTESGSAGDGTFTVTGVGRSTFVCRAGPCLAFSPLYNPEAAPAHAH